MYAGIAFLRKLPDVSLDLNLSGDLVDIVKSRLQIEGDKETFNPQRHGGRSLFVNLHKQDYKDAQHWVNKQDYLTMRQFLSGATTLGIFPKLVQVEVSAATIAER